MKTAISLPDDVFAQAEQAARREGVNRSQFYAKAILFYIQHARDPDTTSQINVVVDELGTDAFGLLPGVAENQTRYLEDEGW